MLYALKSCVKALILCFALACANTAYASDLSTLDGVLREAGVKYKHFQSFDNWEDYKNNPATNGMYLKDDKVLALRLIGGDLKSVNSVSRLRSLKSLILFDNEIQDLSDIPALKKLQYLDLAGNRISDFSPLVNLESLKVLALENNAFNSQLPYKHYYNSRTAGFIDEPNYQAMRFRAVDMLSAFPVSTQKDSANDIEVRLVEPGNIGKTVVSAQTNFQKGIYRVKIRMKITAKTADTKAFSISLLDTFFLEIPYLLRHSFERIDEEGFQEYTHEFELENDLIGAQFAIRSDSNENEIQVDFVDFEYLDNLLSQSNLFKTLNILTTKKVKIHI